MTKIWKVLTDKKSIESEEEIVEELLKIRNIKRSERENFFSPDIASLKLSSVGIDQLEFQKFKKRIDNAIKKNESIIIFGDYDVDGITASAILWETIYSIYKNVKPYIPGRVEEGYGLSVKGIDNILAENPDVKIIITVDNGIVANEAVAYAVKKGIDVIITDHHTAGAKIPKAFCILHTTDLCGAGIAWLLARDLSYDTKEKIQERLELAALATIADLVPLNKWNRCIVVHGLKVLKKTRRIGLQELFKEAKLEVENVNVYAIGHMIAPRLNATGRITHAIDSLRLLCTNNRDKARELALNLGATNKNRQDLTESSVSHAKLLVIKNIEKKRVLVVADESYNAGVIGLIASKLVESYYLPSIAIAIDGDKAKGSARSISGINIIELLRSVSDHLLEAGGHPMAAGFSLATEKIEVFQKAIEEKTAEIAEEIFQRILKIDIPIDFDLLTISLCEKLSLLAPFGMGNPEPVFLSENVRVEDVKLIGREKNHLKLKLSQNNSQKFDAVGFGMAENIPQKGEMLNIVYTLEKNVWEGRESVQLKLKDLKQV